MNNLLQDHWNLLLWITDISNKSVYRSIKSIILTHFYNIFITKPSTKKSNDKWDDVDILFVHLILVRSITYINWI